MSELPMFFKTSININNINTNSLNNKENLLPENLLEINTLESQTGTLNEVVGLLQQISYPEIEHSLNTSYDGSSPVEGGSLSGENVTTSVAVQQNQLAQEALSNAETAITIEDFRSYVQAVVDAAAAAQEAAMADGNDPNDVDAVRQAHAAESQVKRLEWLVNSALDLSEQIDTVYNSVVQSLQLKEIMAAVTYIQSLQTRLQNIIDAIAQPLIVQTMQVINSKVSILLALEGQVLNVSVVLTASSSQSNASIQHQILGQKQEFYNAIGLSDVQDTRSWIKSTRRTLAQLRENNPILHPETSAVITNAEETILSNPYLLASKKDIITTTDEDSELLPSNSMVKEKIEDENLVFSNNFTDKLGIESSQSLVLDHPSNLSKASMDREEPSLLETHISRTESTIEKENTKTEITNTLLKPLVQVSKKVLEGISLSERELNNLGLGVLTISQQLPILSPLEQSIIIEAVQELLEQPINNLKKSVIKNSSAVRAIDDKQSSSGSNSLSSSNKSQPLAGSLKVLTKASISAESRSADNLQRSEPNAIQSVLKENKTPIEGIFNIANLGDAAGLVLASQITRSYLQANPSASINDLQENLNKTAADGKLSFAPSVEHKVLTTTEQLRDSFVKASEHLAEFKEKQFLIQPAFTRYISAVISTLILNDQK